MELGAAIKEMQENQLSPPIMWEYSEKVHLQATRKSLPDAISGSIKSLTFQHVLQQKANLCCLWMTQLIKFCYNFKWTNRSTMACFSSRYKLSTCMSLLTLTTIDTHVSYIHGYITYIIYVYIIVSIMFFFLTDMGSTRRIWFQKHMFNDILSWLMDGQELGLFLMKRRQKC